ncbi:hypothetical protein FRB99_000400 [Tulasnella sp. 403]|nr:hypothetical protein FRB99_000400 [Tulasnella sp. 403]
MYDFWALCKFRNQALTCGGTLVLCFDGTTNIYDQDNTNVIKFFDLLKKDEPDKQMVYYQPGIGTYVSPGMWMPLIIGMSKILDQAFAWYLDAHIMGGYKFLMQNYRPGDRICLFGFSRGAYTARCLAGMLHKVGLLPSSNPEQVPFAYTMYKNSTPQGWAQSAGFKKTFSRTVNIEFVGCWDTVSSVGVIWPRHLPFSSANSIIKTFRHALALDEHRVRFQPNFWHKEAPDASAKRDPEQASTRTQPADRGLEAFVYHPETDVEEVWFAGCHSDVGGGSVINTTPHALGFVSLRWMIEQTIKTQTSILYNPGALKSIGFSTSPFIETRIGVNTLDKYFIKTAKANKYDPVTGDTFYATSKSSGSVMTGGNLAHLKLDTEATTIVDGGTTSRHIQTHVAHPTDHTLVHHTNRARKLEGKDATHQTVVEGETDDERQYEDLISPLYDELKLNPAWWLLEILPMAKSYQDAAGKWHKHLTINFGRARKIWYTDEPKLHISVKERMEAGIGYTPRAHMFKGIECAKWVE